MKIIAKTLILAALVWTATAKTQAQIQVKTNLLYDATTTINIGAEFRLGKKLSLDVPFNNNPWTFENDQRWQHILVQPELRWWPKETFNGHFLGLHGHYADYDIANLPEPFSDYMRNHNFEGWLAGAGLSYGYRWNLGRQWALEATIGAGYAYLDYTKHDANDAYDYEANYFGLTKVGLNLIFGIGKRTEKQAVSVAYTSVRTQTPIATPVQTQIPAQPVQEANPTPWVPVPSWDPVENPILIDDPILQPSFITPDVETVKARSDAGLTYLDFQKGSAEIRTNFRNNVAELRKIHALTQDLKNDPDVTIMGIAINGHASPEGEYAKNLTLSEHRAQALRDHVASVNNLNTDLFAVWGGGEDWATLDSLVSHSQVPDKYRILEIIRSAEYFDIRYRKLTKLAGGSPYRQMEAQFFPQLRRSDYRVNYTVAPFTIERAAEVIRVRPNHLSLNEMYQLAEVYERGSKASNEVFRIAAETFPDSDAANLNAAAGALLCKDQNVAINYLNRVNESSPAYWNNLGILYWLQGDKARAAECFARGGVQGAANAEELQKHVLSLGR